MTALERQQVPIYSATILLGSAARLLLPNSAAALEAVIWPVVVLVIAASQIRQVLDAAGDLLLVTLIFFVYVALAAFICRFTVWLYSLPPRQGRGVIFSTGTRNSFVVLPLALALPAEWQLAVTVIVIQGFVELLGMIVFIHLVPGWLLRETPSNCKNEKVQNCPA